jgi:SAM-dependent methyltransferase
VPSICPELLFQKSSQPISLVRCKDCGLIYVNPRPVLQVRQRLLTKATFWGASYDSYLSREALLRQEARERLATIGRLMKPSRLLDIGSCCGFFLDEARQQGWSAKGAEASKEFSEYARHRFGLDIIDAAVENLDLPAESVDLVTLFGVLEYSFAPRSVFEILHRALAPRGLVFFTVANIRSLDYWVLGARWPWLYPPAHLVHFSKHPLTLMLRRTGFQVRCLWSEAGPDDLFAASAKSLLGDRWAQREKADGTNWRHQLRKWANAGLKRAYRIAAPFVCQLGIGGKLAVIAQKL